MPPAKIIGKTSIDRCIVAEGCIIDQARLEHSVIGIRSRIGNESVVTNSYLMGNDHFQNLDVISDNIYNNRVNIGIGKRCLINNTIVDKSCKIGDDVILNGGAHLEDANTDLYTIKGGIIVVKKGAALPHRFTIK